MMRPDRALLLLLALAFVALLIGSILSARAMRQAAAELEDREARIVQLRATADAYMTGWNGCRAGRRRPPLPLILPDAPLTGSGGGSH